MMAADLLAASQRGDAVAIGRILAADEASDLPNVRDDRHMMPALHWACASDEEASAKALLADRRTDRTALSAHGMSALHVAASANAPRALSLLLSEGFDVNAINEWGETPLHVAATAGSQAAVALLIEGGADTSKRDKWDRTAATVARQQGLDPVKLGLPLASVAE